MAKPRYQAAFWPPRPPKRERTDAADLRPLPDMAAHVAEVKRELAQSRKSQSPMG